MTTTREDNVQWFIARDGKPHGPMSAGEMALFVEGRHLRETDLVWRQGFAEWLPALKVFPPEPAGAPVPPPAAPPPEPVPGPAQQESASAHQAAPQGVAPSARVEPAPVAAAPVQQQMGQHSVAAQPVADQPVTAQPVVQQTAHPQWPQPQYPHAQYPEAQYPEAQYPEAQYSQAHYSQAQNHAPISIEPRPAMAPVRPSASLRHDAGRETTIVRTTARLSEAPRGRSAGRRAAIWIGAIVLLVGIGGLGAFVARMGFTPRAGTAQSTEAKATTTAVKATEKPKAAPVLLPVDSIDKELQRSPVWRLLKAEFADWYAPRLQDIARLRAEKRDEEQVTRHLHEQIVVLRRQFSLHGLSASHDKLRQVATAFHANLAGLAKHSPEACFGFISRGEVSPIVLKLAQTPEHGPHLEAQIVSVIEAIVDGRRAPQVHRPPQQSDYDVVLVGELRARGWSDKDFKMFTDEQQLSSAPPAQVCRLVQDWFASQLAVKDPAVQLRLLVEALRPILKG